MNNAVTKEISTNTPLLSKMTLVIPTYNRHQHLKKLIEYYKSQCTPISFIILDSSDQETLEKNSHLCRELGDKAKHITYASSTQVADKLLDGLKQVVTPFCGFCADDDLVFVDGIVAAIAFLQSHDDYVSADGIYLNFHTTGTDVNVKLEYSTRGIQAEDPGARIFQLCQKYESLFYGVFRTNDAVSIFTGVTKHTSLHYQELFQAMAALLIGKSKRLPIIYAARQHCDPADMTRDKWQTYYWFADEPEEFLAHYRQYREGLWLFYQAHASTKTLTVDKFNQLTDIAHAMYFGLGCPPEYFHTSLQTYWPNDNYQNRNHFSHNVCNELKHPFRVKYEGFSHKFAEWMPNKIASIYRLGSIYRLNRKMAKQLGTRLRCQLSPEVRWLASTDKFANAYRELCRYINLC